MFRLESYDPVPEDPDNPCDQNRQAVEVIRHMVRGWRATLEQSNNLVRMVLKSISKFYYPEHSDHGSRVLQHLCAMNNVPLCASNSIRSHGVRNMNSTGRLQKLVRVLGEDVFPKGDVPNQEGAFAMWSSLTEANTKTAVLDILGGQPSRIQGVDRPRIEFGELKSMALKLNWGKERTDGSGYVDFHDVAPFGIQDDRFKELGLREKGAFLMIFPDQMEKFDATAHRHYVKLLDKYKAAVSKERSDRKKASAAMKKQGHVSLLACELSPDYDEQFPTADDPPQVAYLTHRLEQVETQLKATEDAMAAEAAASVLKTEKEREAKRTADVCRSMLKHILPAGSQADHDQDVEQVVAEFMASHSRVGDGL